MFLFLDRDIVGKDKGRQIGNQLLVEFKVHVALVEG
jgi:hypothetical protein